SAGLKANEQRGACSCHRPSHHKRRERVLKMTLPPRKIESCACQVGQGNKCKSRERQFLPFRQHGKRAGQPILDLDMEYNTASERKRYIDEKGRIRRPPVKRYTGNPVKGKGEDRGIAPKRVRSRQSQQKEEELGAAREQPPRSKAVPRDEQERQRADK